MTDFATVWLDSDAPGPPIASIGWAILTALVQEGSGEFPVVVTMDPAQAEDVQVTFQRTGGDALEGLDYDLTTQSPVTIPAGQTAAPVLVQVLQNDKQLEDVTLQLTLTGAVIRGGFASDPIDGPNSVFDLSIQNTTVPDGVVAEWRSTTSLVPEDQTAEHHFRIDLSEPAPAGGVLVNVDHTGGTAVEGVNFTWVTDPDDDIVIPEGVQAGIFRMNVIEVPGPSGDTTVELTITSVTPGSVGADDVHVVTITDAEPVPVLDLSPASQTIMEGIALGQEATIFVTPSGGSGPDGTAGYDLTVPYTITGGTNGVNYQLLSPSPLVIPAEAPFGRIRLRSIPNTIDEDLVLTAAINGADPSFNGALGAVTSATVTITNVNLPRVRFALSQDTVTEGGGPVTCSVILVDEFNQTLPNNTGQNIVVTVLVNNGETSAQEDDYSLDQNVLVFTPNSQLRNITITIADDMVAEQTERLVLDIANVDNGQIGSRSQYRLTILDDDAPLSIIPPRQALPDDPDIRILVGTVLILTGPEAGMQFATNDELRFAAKHAQPIWMSMHGPGGSMPETYTGPDDPNLPYGSELRPVRIDVGPDNPQNLGQGRWAANTYPSGQTGGAMSFIGTAAWNLPGYPVGKVRDIAFVGLGANGSTRLGPFHIWGTAGGRGWDNIRFENFTLVGPQQLAAVQTSWLWAIIGNTSEGKVKLYDGEFDEHPFSQYPNGGVDGNPWGFRYVVRGTGLASFDVRNWSSCSVQEHVFYLDGPSGKGDTYFQNLSVEPPGTGRTLVQIPQRVGPGGGTDDFQPHVGRGVVILENCQGYQDLAGSDYSGGGATFTLKGGQVDYTVRNCAMTYVSADSTNGYQNLIVASNLENIGDGTAGVGLPANELEWYSRDRAFPCAGNGSADGLRRFAIKKYTIDGVTKTFFSTAGAQRAELDIAGVIEIDVNSFELNVLPGAGNLSSPQFIIRNDGTFGGQAGNLLYREASDFGIWRWGEEIDTPGPPSSYSGWAPTGALMRANDTNLSNTVINDLEALSASRDFPFESCPYSPGTPVMPLIGGTPNRGTAPTVASGACGTKVQFYHNTAGQGITNLLWDFGDGTTSTEQHPRKFYGVAGNYTVMLTGISNGTMVNSDPMEITVSPLRAYQPMTVFWDLGPSHNFNETSTNPNPWTDFRLDVAIQNLDQPSLRYNARGFFWAGGYEGSTGQQWAVRFTPTAPGNWRFTPTFEEGVPRINLMPLSTTGNVVPLQTFTFSVAAADPDAPGFYAKGPLEYDPRFHHLRFADGSFFIKTGVDSPENFLAYSGFDDTVHPAHPAGQNGAGPSLGILHSYPTHAVPPDYVEGEDPQWNKGTIATIGAANGIIGAINYLASAGVNSVYMMVMNLGGDGQDVHPYTPGLISSNGPWLNFDISKLRQWNTLFEHMMRKGVMCHFVLSEEETANTNWLDGGAMGDERKALFTILASHFGYLNAVKWNLGEEISPPPGGDEFSWAEIQQMGEYLRHNHLLPFNHPIAMHTDNTGIQYQLYQGVASGAAGNGLWFSSTSIQDAAQNVAGAMRMIQGYPWGNVTLPSTVPPRAWPNALTTGPRIPLSVDATDGTIETTSAGQVIEGIHFTNGELQVRHPDVIIRDCLFDSIMGNFHIRVLGPPVGGGVGGDRCTIEYCEFDHDGTRKAIIVGNLMDFYAPSDVTIRRCHIHDHEDGIFTGGDVQNLRVLDNYMHDMGPFPEAHSDGLQFLGGDNCLVQGNNWDFSLDAEPNNAAVLASTVGAPINNLRIIDNRFIDNGTAAFLIYTVVNTVSNLPHTNYQLFRNRLGPLGQNNFWSNTAQGTSGGNVWDATGGQVLNNNFNTTNNPPVPRRIVLDYDEQTPAGSGLSPNGNSTTGPVPRRKNSLYDALFNRGGIEWYMGANDQNLEDFRTRSDAYNFSRIAREFLETFRFHEMINDPTRVSGHDSTDGGPEVMYTRFEAYLVYSARWQQVGTLNLSGESGTATVRWMNPSSGAITNAGTISLPGAAPGGNWPMPNPPSSPGEDWVLAVTFF